MWSLVQIERSCRIFLISIDIFEYHLVHLLVAFPAIKYLEYFFTEQVSTLFLLYNLGFLIQHGHILAAVLVIFTHRNV